MKKGLEKGMQAACCTNFEVWGLSSNAPNFNNLSHIQTPAGRPAEFPYDVWGGYVDETDTYGQDESITVTVTPVISERAIGNVWELYAAKVPGTYPYKNCETLPPSSSSEDNTWKVLLDTIADHSEYSDSEGGEIQVIRGLTTAGSSRVIYRDGQQAFVTYTLTPKSEGFKISQNNKQWDMYVQDTVVQDTFGGGKLHGEHFQINIDHQSLSQTYRVDGFLIDREFDAVLGNAMPPTQMEIEFRNFTKISTLPYNGFACSACAPAQQKSFGIDYYVTSSYHPDTDYTLGGSWKVGRVFYTGTRLGVTGSLEFFCSDINTGKESEMSYAGEYVIMLPSCRVYIDSTAPQPDECWVTARTLLNATDKKLVTGRWLDKVYRPGIGSEDETTGVADGTLTSGENIIVDTSNSLNQAIVDFPDENWNNLRVRCYNHIYKKDYILFTTNGSGITVSPMAGFENDDINDGLPSGLQFSNGGPIAGSMWIPDTDTPYSGTYSAKSNVNAIFSDEADLEIEINVTQGGDLSFYYILDNRWYGTRVPPFGELSNNPDIDNNLTIFIDGNTTAINIEGVDYTTSIIDNSFVPEANPFNDPAFYLTWKKATITLTPGTHSIRWTLYSRYQSNGHLFAKLDNIQFPEILNGDDIDGSKRWFYDGNKVRRAQWWTWAKRNDEDNSHISERVRTVPDFITADANNNILYGNPHYLFRLIYDSGSDAWSPDPNFGFPRAPGLSGEGCIRFTASPYNAIPLPSCIDPSPDAPVADSISDPPWGSFQILPTSTHIQIRGANGTMRDAYPNYPIDKKLFTYIDPRTDTKREELFVEILTVRESSVWTQRPHAWTIDLDGKTLRPHIEVIWRPTMFHPAWPVADWPHKPYRSDFATATLGDEWNALRPRDPLALVSGSTLPRWSRSNYIITNTYTDSFTLLPQLTWVVNGGDPPDDNSDPRFWDPDYDHATASFFGVPGGPWPTAKWHLRQAKFIPLMQFNLLQIEIIPNTTTLMCPDDNPNTGTDGPVFYMQSNSAFQNPMPDFDAVDCGCSCCDN
jgi:hypothetical protein